MNLLDIYRPIQKELERVDREFEKELQGYDGFSSTILEFLLGDQGKKLRPALTLFSARVGGGVSQEVVRLATAVELLHTATLIHDDVLDEALLRRKKMSLNFRWGNEISVVMGDYVYAKAFIILSELQDQRLMRSLTETARVICMGELAQLEKRYDFTLSEEAYLSMIERKTASLISRACELGGYLGGAQVSEMKQLSGYGRHFGIGFQIIDDCLDLFGDEEKMGKSLGTDVRKGKPTLPLIYLLKELTSSEKEKLKQLFLEAQDGEVMGEVRRLIAQYGTLDKSMKRAHSYLQSAQKEIVDLRYESSRESLMQLAEFTLKRDR